MYMHAPMNMRNLELSQQGVNRVFIRMYGIPVLNWINPAQPYHAGCWLSYLPQHAIAGSVCFINTY